MIKGTFVIILDISLVGFKGNSENVTCTLMDTAASRPHNAWLYLWFENHNKYSDKTFWRSRLPIWKHMKQQLVYFYPYARIKSPAYSATGSAVTAVITLQKAKQCIKSENPIIRIIPSGHVRVPEAILAICHQWENKRAQMGAAFCHHVSLHWSIKKHVRLGWGIDRL